MNDTQAQTDEIEIDLRKYVIAIWERRRAIVILTVIGAILGSVLALVSPPEYEAISGVAIIKTKTDVVFDPRVKTMSSDDLAAAGVALTSADARRNALLTLVNSGQIASEVINVFSKTLSADEATPSALLRRVKSELAQKGDFILIRVRYADPDVAAQLANEWGRRYAAYANAIYADKQPDYTNSVSNEVSQRRAAYNEAQKGLEAFLADNQIEPLRREISSTERLVRGLSDEQSEAIRVTLQKQANLRTLAISQTLETQRLAASAVITGETYLNIRLLYEYYDAHVQYSQMLDEAKSLKAQVTQGGEAASKTNTLAIVLLKARALSGLEQVPNNLQINISASNEVSATQSEQIADLDALTNVLSDRLKTIDAEIQRLSGLLNHPSSGVGISPTQAISGLQWMSNTIDVSAFANVGNLSNLNAINVDNDPLTHLIQSYVQRLNQAQAKLEEQLAHKEDLTKRRDVERDAYVTLLSKQTEVQVSDALTGSEVRFASEAIVPDQRVIGRSLYTLVGAAVGFVLSLLIIVSINFMSAGVVATIKGNQILPTRILRWIFARN